VHDQRSKTTDKTTEHKSADYQRFMETAARQSCSGRTIKTLMDWLTKGYRPQFGAFGEIGYWITWVVIFSMSAKRRR
jgi:hypothetical protein